MKKVDCKSCAAVSKIGTKGAELQLWRSSLFRFPLLVPGLLSGLIYTLSIPKFDYYFLAWLCLLPLLLARHWLPTAQHFSLGLISGIAWGGGRAYWISETLQLYGNLSLIEAASTTILLILYMALYVACFTAACIRLDFKSPLFAWKSASIWVLLEWMQSWMISGFPWQLLGYSQYLNLPLLQFSAITGVYGLSFLIALFNAALAQTLWHRTIAPYLAVPLVLLASIHLWGLYRLHSFEDQQPPSLKVGVVQGNISQDRKWKVNRLSWTTNHYAELTRQLAISEQPDLILYPETALPLYFGDPFYAPFTDSITDLAIELRTTILVGSLKGSYQDNHAPTYNRAFLLDTTGQIADSVDKVHLVPFGEFLPFPWLFQYLEALTAESGAFTHGERHKALTLPGSDISFGVFICYESIFPEITRVLMQQNPDFLVNTTNDAWFGTTAAPHQHWAQVVLRAVESGRTVVRAANTGISGMIEASGRTAYATELFTTETFSVDVPLHQEQTIYSRFGDVLLIACALFLATTLLRHKMHRE